MNVREQHFDKCIQLNAKANHKEYIDKITAKLISYYSDPNKKWRKEHNHLCKYCNYVNTDRIGGAMLTTVTCGNCGQEMTVANTCTDLLCDECAKELNCCKHCGQKMD